MEPIEILVLGIPKTAGSKRGFAVKKGGQYTGRVVIMDDSGQAGTDWRGDVKAAALRVVGGAPLLTGAIRLDVSFHLPRPAGHFGTGRNAGRLKKTAPQHHTKKPDRTKLLRSVEDALTKIVWADDSQVVAGECVKEYTNIDRPGVRIQVSEVSG